MPNWVTHKLTLRGEPDTLRLFLERHLRPLDEQEADGSAASQQNGELTGEGSKLPVEKSLSGAEESEPVENIPVYAVYPDGTVKQEIRIPTGPVLDFETLLPLGDKDPSDVWDTKWNASMGRISGDPALGSVTIWFDTPWSIPEPIFDAIAEKYPGLKAEGHAFDEVWNFAATISIKDGSSAVETVDANVELYREVYGKDPETIPHRDADSEADDGDEDDYEVDTLYAAVAEWLDENDWGYDEEEKLDADNAYQITTGMEVTGQKYHVIIDVYEDTIYVAVCFYTPYGISSDLISEMAVLLNWINDVTRLGRLAVPLLDEPAPIQWKASIDVEESELSPTQIGTLISAGAGTFERYAEAISFVAHKKMTAEDAIKKWEQARASEDKR